MATACDDHGQPADQPARTVDAGHVSGRRVPAIDYDTNDYFHPSISADGEAFVASQLRGQFQIGVAPVGTPDAVQPVPLAFAPDIGDWDWAADGRLVIPQTPDIRLVNRRGGETVCSRNAQHVTDQVTTCAGGKYFVFRTQGAPGSGAESLEAGQQRNESEAAYVWPQ